MSQNCFLKQILEPPQYAFDKDGVLYRPTHKELWQTFFTRLNPSRSRGHWLSLFSWIVVAILVVPFILFFTSFFSWPLFACAFVYSMVLMGSHGTLYLHRYGTHRAYRFKSKWALFVVRNLVIKIIPEEIYVISHHVHHKYSEQPGDPYNVHGGWLYCFLADANHQVINQEMDESTYNKVKALLSHMGVKTNSYQQYLKWGSICHPLRTIAHYFLNWAFWFGFFYLVGGLPLAVAIFAGAGTWAVGIRTFNYEGHGKGKDKRQDGIDFNRTDLSINQVWPGYVAGEWHNNHHLYPSGARSGFLPYQVDLPWYFISGMKKLGLVKNIIDPKEDFLKKHYHPYQENKTVSNKRPSAIGQLQEDKPSS